MKQTKYFAGIILLVAACSQQNETKQQHTLFTSITGDQSGIHFNNTITENEIDTTLLLEFAYMGGGVGIGDFNNDGLKDIFFTGNQVSNRLYINKGNNHFEDITDSAGLASHVWSTGVSIVDINNDGFDDIYVCTFGHDLKRRTKNLLYINQGTKAGGKITFTEEAADYNLADTSYTAQAAFFDYDMDGDLDVFLANYLIGPNANNIFPRDLSGTSAANDRLYRNDGDSLHTGHPHFTDVTMDAGIKEDGYGLGLVISDINGDSWPDIYVSSDFLPNDRLWINNRNGTFTNTISTSMKHQSYSSMGADVADINNDDLPDVSTLDMMPENNERKKISFSFMSYERYQMERFMNYEPEFVRNMLQLNNGVRMQHDTAVPYFSEIGQLAGIAETDWSWSVLMADFNNDGYKDMHITNGIGRDFINADFVQFSQTVAIANETARRKVLKAKLASLDHVNLKDYLFLNNKDLTFRNLSDSSGDNEPSMSNGAAYADLDNDGDLDLVVSNINKEASVLINNTIQKDSSIKNHYLQIELVGDSSNRHAFGSKVAVNINGISQLQEQSPVRGYLSSVDTKLTFGLGDQTKVTVVVTWPDNTVNFLTNVYADTLLVIKKKERANMLMEFPPLPHFLFSDVTKANNIQYKHTDADYNDFATQRLLPQKYSQLGPFITTGDINGDGLTDFFAGGGFNSWGQVFIQQKDGTYKGKPLADTTKMQEDMDCLLFDADNDKDLDLLITCGDPRYDENSPFYIPRLYRNDGKGNFSLQSNAIPASVKTMAGCVSAADYDGDGDQDIFIGGRVAKQFPLAPKSFILRNDNGIFTDVTATVCPALQNAGMISGGVWSDFDNDKLPDLVIAGEWMPVRFFKNMNGTLKEVTAATGLQNTEGMWRSLIAADIDKDGDIDFIAGNLGLNCVYHTTADYPMKLFAKDLDDNGSIDPFMFYYIKTNDGSRKLYPALNRDMLSSQVPAVKKQFLLHTAFANATFDDIYPGDKKKGLLELTCHETRSCYFENLGNGKFVMHALPVEAQFAPVNAIICEDLTGDGIKDILLAGNEYQTEVMTGRYDASYGCFLKGNNNKTFTSVPSSKSGFIIDGDVKSMKFVPAKKSGWLVLAGVNNDYMKVFTLSPARATN